MSLNDLKLPSFNLYWAKIWIKHGFFAGMAYRFTDISVKLIYRHFFEVSVNVRTNKLSVIGFGQISALNIAYILVFFS